MKEKEKTEEKKENRKVQIAIIIVAIIIAIAILLSVIFAILNISNTKMMNGIKIENIDVSGLEKEEALVKVKKTLEDKISKDMTLKYEEYETTISLGQLDVSYNVEKAIEQAYSIGRSENIVINNYKILGSILFKKEINAEVTIDKTKVKKVMDNISANLPGAIIESSYYIEDKNLIITKGKEGIQVDEQLFDEIINKTINNLNRSNDFIEIPIKNKVPDPINIEKIHTEIYKQPQDAYITKDPVEVHAHVNGVDFDISIEEAEQIIKEDKEEYTIPLKITIPDKTINDLGEEAFPSVLGTYTTRYDASNKNRSTNISLASDKINGTVILPGEIFSYNQIVGKRTVEAGYKEAAAYAGGQVVQDVGGGICQVSSTLYNSVLLSNLEIVDRSNHHFLTSYVPAGRDATVSWGTVDFKFKNNRTYPIKIITTAKNGIVKIDIKGIPEKAEYEVVIQSKIIETIPYTVKYKEDSSIESGKEIIDQQGTNGCKSEAYKILKQNGAIISTSLLSKDTYNAMERIVTRGTKNGQKTTNNTPQKEDEKIENEIQEQIANVIQNKTE